MLTNDLFVGAISMHAYVDNIEQCLARCKSTDKIFEISNVRDDTCAHKLFSDTFDIGVNPTNDAQSEWGGVAGAFALVLHIVLNRGVQLRGGAATAVCTFAYKLIEELVARSAKQKWLLRKGLTIISSPSMSTITKELST